ncbi:MAG: PPE domain-containing protein [Pseudonocardiales bacterium]|nr:PPE domain-containing protein [Pseudonocardiales bacterium]MBV9029035.1 PPE domain-containing protein [Pseudonocardiales bacterium]MBW0010553.1 PPE domain-containing protein [Pseudonocardiales bacterium]
MGTNVDYSTVSHETIYHHITGGPGGTEMMDASRAWHSVAAQLREIQSIVEHAVRGIGAAQQGAAADAATHATMAMAPWVAETATTANGMAIRVREQAGVFAHTRDSMPPPRAVPEVSFSQDPGTWIADHAVEWLPGIQTEHERAQVAAQQDEQRARELMSGYQGTSNEILAVHQHFTAAPAVVAEVAPPAPGGGVNGGWSTHTHPSPVHPSVVHRGVVRSATSHLPVSHPGAVTGGHGRIVAPAATISQLASGARHAPAAVAPQLAGGYPGPSADPMAGPGSVRPAMAAPFGPSPMPTRSGTTDEDRRRGGPRSSGGGGVSRSGGFGPRPSAAFGTGDSPLSGSAGQSGPLHSGAEQTGTGRPGRDGAGFANAPLGATGGSGRGGDTAHRRPSYLVEQDTNAIVGELPQVAPPVIGADEDYR